PGNGDHPRPGIRPAARLARRPPLADRDDELAAPVERLLLLEHVGSHRFTAARVGLGCPERIAGLPRGPEGHAHDLLLILRPVCVGAQHALWVRLRAPRPLEVGQHARPDPACRHPDKVLLHRGLLFSFPDYHSLPRGPALTGIPSCASTSGRTSRRWAG